MELRSAYDVMGLKYDCSQDDAKKTYRARAILLHPDRVDGGLRRDAEAAMAQLNEAWGMVRGDIERGRAGRVAEAAVQELIDSVVLHAPGRGECDFCGWSPTKPMRQCQFTGLLLFWRSSGPTFDLCRKCGDTFFADSQSHCMTKGWWGAFAFWVNFLILAFNGIMLAGHRRGLPMPKSRDPLVLTPVNVPMVAIPVRRRPLPLVVTLVAVGLAIGLVVSPSGTKATSSPSPATGGVGSCLTEGGRPIDCSDSLAIYRLVSQVATPDSCTGVAFQNAATKAWYCTSTVK